MSTSPEQNNLALGKRFVAALEHRAWEELKALFDPGVVFRALIPRGLRDAENRDAATAYLQRWFGDADQLILESTNIEMIQDRLHLAYRFRAHEDQWYIVEQHAYCTILDGRIRQIDLLCSGFRPEGPGVIAS